MTTSVEQQILYAGLTWPEVNEAIALEKVILLPVGSTEQHGPHLPLDVDTFLAESVCMEAARRSPTNILVAPTIPYGFNVHAMDFPGTVHVSYDFFIDYCTSVCKSFAYHGFKRIMLVDGHGSNEHLLEFVARRTILETDALVSSFMWWNLLRTNPNFIATFRESVFPGGCAHACEVETSMYMHLKGEHVRKDKIEDHIAWYNEDGVGSFHYTDAFGAGPVALVEYTSTYTPNGVMGQPSLASAEKGKVIFEETVTQLVNFVGQFQRRPSPPRVDHHTKLPTIPQLKS
jgi:creatinine amidohydrolase